jgi:hypothetical protein
MAARRYHRPPTGRGARDRRVRQDVGVPLSRLAWVATVAGFVLAGVLLLLSDYTGYGILAFAVAASAAINLR